MAGAETPGLFGQEQMSWEGGCAGSTAFLWDWGRVWDIFPPNPSFWDGCGAAGCLLTPAEHPELVNEQNAFSYTEGILNWLHMDSGGCRTFPEGDGMSRNVGLMKEARH